MSLLSRLAVQASRAYGLLASADKTKVVAEYLSVAGGGGGGAGVGGGGGAGGLLASTATLSTLNTYSIVVGAGGSSGVTNSSAGGNGSTSTISGTGLTTITSTGGGGGGTEIGSYAPGSGGSGGGGAGAPGSNRTGGAGTSGQGYAGGNGGADAPNYGSGGGGGAGAVGANGTTTTGGNGGVGVASSISGTSTYYAGGGGGGLYIASGTPGTGGNGGGGNGSEDGVAGIAGTTNLGGGGGGGGTNSTGSSRGNGGQGGSGIVIISYTSATPKFVGGTITTSGGKQIHTFTSSGTLSPITPITASYLVVAGGGAGGGVASTNYYGGGGGGAGGLLSGSTTLYSGASYVVTVGAGAAGSATNTRASNGSDSSLSGTGLTTLTSTGGGSGGTQSTNTGASGGSGGGGQNSSAGGSGTSGQGYAGGTAVSGGAGGGGGSSAVGSNGTSSNSGAGGNGTASSITGSSVTYAGGGGGGGYKGAPAINGGSGGTGGGGTGAPSTGGAGGSGTPNSGSGGGGACWFSADVAGGSGGSGIVIISYAGSQQFNGGLVTSSGGNTIHTFTSTGALTPLTNNLNNSLRFRSSASASLSRTFLAGNQTTWTWSAWVKRGLLANYEQLFATGASNDSMFYFNNDDTIIFQNGALVLQTTQVFRDPSAWYHIVFNYDSTQATSSNRLRLYINGNQVTAFSSATYPSQNATSTINSAITHYIATRSALSQYFDGYMTDINFIDGQALAPYYFGNNDANGVWKPIQYKGTYGTNGFYLTFGNTTSTTTLGYDSSPNGNNWTCNNISLTAGTTYDAMTDVPTNTSATVANYPTLNPINKASTSTISNANLGGNSNGSTWNGVVATMEIPSTGKYYWEVTASGANTQPGIVSNTSTNFSTALATYPANGFYSYTYYASNGYKVAGPSNTQTAYGATYTNGDVIGIALDMDAGTLTFYKNNSSQGTAFTGLTDKYLPYLGVYDSGVQAINFGQRPFTYTPPTGFVALNTYNLPTPTILQGNKYMDATLWTGNGAATNVIVNQAQFKPDFVWIKPRTSTSWHNIYDSIRGVGKELNSNYAGAEITNNANGYLNSFDSNGFTVVKGSTGTDNVNANSITFVGWNWQAGQGSTSSNTSGSLTSTVSVNTTAGFSIVTYTGTGVAATVGHGLGVAPKFIIVKNRSAAESWRTYHVVPGATKYLNLNTTEPAVTASSVWNNTAPTSTVFSIANDAGVSGNGNNLVAYCWTEITGYSKFGSYVGNANADGPFVYLGFKPKYILIKDSTTTGYNWYLFDSSRNTYNVMGEELEPNLGDAAATQTDLDFTSNGFKIRVSALRLNNSNDTYIYAAFAENPFKISNAR